MQIIKLYQTITHILMDYIHQNHLYEKASLFTGLYRLYHLEQFENWKEAFAYLKQVAAILFDLTKADELDHAHKMTLRIREYVDAHLAEDLTLSSISNEINYNSHYVSRIFKQVMGIGIPQYVTQARVARAQEYLLNTRDSIQTIPEKTGFDTPQYFAMVFKKHIGVSPNEYRRQP